VRSRFGLRNRDHRLPRAGGSAAGSPGADSVGGTSVEVGPLVAGSLGAIPASAGDLLGSAGLGPGTAQAGGSNRLPVGGLKRLLVGSDGPRAFGTLGVNASPEESGLLGAASDPADPDSAGRLSGSNRLVRESVWLVEGWSGLVGRGSGVLVGRSKREVGSGVVVGLSVLVAGESNRLVNGRSRLVGRSQGLLAGRSGLSLNR